MQEFLDIPGDYLEGGGQILRTSLALSCILKKPVRIYNIRLKRPNPGLQPQHFAVIRALRDITQAKVDGFSLGSQEIRFSPSQISSLELNIDIKTAGSIGLLLQSLIPVAAFSPEGISAKIKGGTTGKSAIPIEYYPAVIIPILKRIGVDIKLELIKRGYYPKGGGEVTVSIKGRNKLYPIDLIEQGRVERIEGISHSHKELKKRSVSERQKDSAIDILKKRFNCPIDIVCEYSDSLSLGSGIVLWARTDSQAIIGADSMGEKGKPAEDIGREAAEKLIGEIDSGSPVDSHLADNLIIWLALAGGKIKVSSLSLHTQTNIWITEKFLGRKFLIEGNIISYEPFYTRRV